MIFETGRNTKGSILFRIRDDGEGDDGYEVEVSLTPEDALHISKMLSRQAEKARREQRGDWRPKPDAVWLSGLSDEARAWLGGRPDLMPEHIRKELGVDLAGDPEEQS